MWPARSRWLRGRLILNQIICAAALLLILLSPSSLQAATTIVIVVGDAPGVGFNDATPTAPVGGNSGTTLGQQRLNAFQAAADKWGATVTSSVPIRIGATWEALFCNATSAILGSARPTDVFQGFAGAPKSFTWFSFAQANAIFGSDLDPTRPQITARVNVNLGQAGCLTGTFFYLGLDNNHGNDIDLVTVLEHEFAHGLGFLNFTDGATGILHLGSFSIWDYFLLDTTTNKLWKDMTDAERAASALNTHGLVWNGPNVTAAVPSVLQTGADSFGRPFMYAPNPYQSGPSISHWDTTALPNQLMEPAINGDLTHELIPPADLTFMLLLDIGWPSATLKKRRGQIISN